MTPMPVAVSQAFIETAHPNMARPRMSVSAKFCMSSSKGYVPNVIRSEGKNNGR